MIKEGVVKSEKTPCPITGHICKCDHPENDCALTRGKTASVSQLGAMLSQEEDNK